MFDDKQKLWEDDTINRTIFGIETGTNKGLQGNAEQAINRTIFGIETQVPSVPDLHRQPLSIAPSLELKPR